MNVIDARMECVELILPQWKKDEKIPSRVVEQVEAEMAINDRLEIK